jgi:hypothetical protein
MTSRISVVSVLEALFGLCLFWICCFGNMPCRPPAGVTMVSICEFSFVVKKFGCHLEAAVSHF